MPDRYQPLRDALAALGPAEWHSPGLGEVHDAEHTTIAQCVGTEWSDERQEHYPGLTQGQPVADYIAAADPDTIRELLAERDQLAAEIEALRAEVERLNRILERIVEGDGDSTVAIRAGADAFAAAREYLRPNA